MSTVPSAAAKDFSSNEQATKRVRIRVANYARQNGILETFPPTLRRAGGEDNLGIRIGLNQFAPVECRWPVHAGRVALEEAVPVRRSTLGQGAPEPLLSFTAN